MMLLQPREPPIPPSAALLPQPIMAWLKAIFSYRTFYDSHSSDCGPGQRHEDKVQADHEPAPTLLPPPRNTRPNEGWRMTGQVRQWV